jgi:shikimate kinase
MSIVLVGYRGCGKTTIGRRLADRLWQPFADTDEMIVRQAGKTIADIFEQHGESHFRSLETQAVKEACSAEEQVIALGGGALVREENQAVLKESGHKVIYLKCDPRELLKRIQSDARSPDSRPPLTPQGGGLDEIKKVLGERETIYRAAMTAELDVTHLTPEDACVYIVRLL